MKVDDASIKGGPTLLEMAGWKRYQTMGMVDFHWVDPEFPRWVYAEPEAVKIQEGRDIEKLKASS